MDKFKNKQRRTQSVCIEQEADDDAQTDNGVLDSAFNRCKVDLREAVERTISLFKTCKFATISNYDLRQRVKFPNYYKRDGKFESINTKKVNDDKEFIQNKF